MAVSQKPNEEYWALKSRLDKWGLIVIFICPIIFLSTLGFGGSFIGGKLFPPYGFLIGFMIGGMTAQAICFTLWMKKLGFLMYSKEKCQNCGESIGRWNGAWIGIDYLCRSCGNNNSVDLHDT